MYRIWGTVVRNSVVNSNVVLGGENLCLDTGKVGSMNRRIIIEVLKYRCFGIL